MKINLDTKYYYIINEDLGMSKGKLCAQVSHVAMMLSEEYSEVGRAIVLKAKETKLKSLIDMPELQPVFYINDAGFTEVPEGSLTCIGFKENDFSQKFTKRLRLI